jgi:cellulose biosynthesis protein BcsQ
VTVIAVYNIKGGVGKTATAVNLGWHAARDGVRTLIWDMDPQGAASFYLRVRPRTAGGARKLVRGRRDADDVIKGTDYDGLDLLPADFSNRHLDLYLEQAGKPRKRLRRLLGPLADEFALVLLDCAPSISLVSESVFRAADVLLVPSIPTTLSLRTLEQLVRFRAGHPRIEARIWPFFSMVDRRKSLHRELVENPPTHLGDWLGPPIPSSSVVERMGLERTPVGVFAPASDAARAYAALWRALSARLPVG